MSIKKASEIKEGDEVNFWPGFVQNQMVERVAKISDRTTKENLILIKTSDDDDNDGLKWPPSTEILVIED